MKYGVRVNHFFIIVFHIVILTIEAILLVTIRSNTIVWTTIAGISIIVNFMLEIIYLIRNKYLFSIGGVFITFSYLFQCSFAVLLMFDAIKSSDRFYTLFIPSYGIETFKTGVNVAIIFIGACFIGYITGREKYAGKPIKKIYNIGATSTKIIGWVMTVMFGIIYFYSVLQVVLRVNVIGSYSILSEYRNTASYTMANSLHIYYFVGLLILMNYYKNINRNGIVNGLLVMSIFSAVLLMLTGARSRAVVYVVIILLMWVKHGKKLNTGRIIAYIIGGIIFLQLLYAIRVTRKYNFNFSFLVNAFFSNNNVLYETMSEFGWSVFVTGILESAAPVWHPIDFIVKEIGSILPRSAAWGGNIFLAPTVLTGVEAHVHGGTTYIADFYYYYGGFGIIILFALGFWIAYWDDRLEQYFQHKDFVHVAIILGWANGILNSIRSPATFNIKLFVYSYLIVFVVSIFVLGGRIKIIDVHDEKLIGGSNG